MPLAAGTRLGLYEIVASLGAGGMGEVYRGRDTRLGRDVALKILPDLVARDKERLARFDREAKLLASLAHPNIATLYALEQIDGRPVLVMELAPGEDLSARIDRGPMPLDDALPLAIQVASALEAAHERGIIHRDLKPANIKVGDDGSVKVLDFGLAKAFGPDDADSSSAMNSPTLTAQATAAGVILGTAAYMSPEQARGRAADKRADIWSFGVVLFEMRTGSRLFQGETISDTLAAVLRQEIDFASLPASTPVELTRLLRRCLERDRKNRLHDIADARILLGEIARGDPGEVPVDRTNNRRFSLWTMALWSLAAVGLGVLLGQALPRSEGPAEADPVRLSVTAPEGVTWITRPTLSRDGRLLAFTGSSAARTDLYLQRLDEFAVRRLDRTEGASSAFFSPDGRWIGFYRRGALEKISVDGGDPLPLLPRFPYGTGIVWSDDNRLILQPTWVSGLAVIEPGATAPRSLTTPDAARGERAHWLPNPLPDGRYVLFTIMRRGSGVNDAEVAVLDTATGKYDVILTQAAEACYVPPGFLLFVRAGEYHVIRFDLRSRTVSGEPRRVLEDARSIVPEGEKASISVSSNGTLVYVLGGGARLPMSRLIWISEGGKQEPVKIPPHAYADLSLSSDGRMAAAGVLEGGRYVVRLLTLDRGLDVALDMPGSNWSAFWHPDNRRLAVRSMRKGDFDLYVKDISSSEPPKEFLVSDFDDSPLGWIPPDGKTMLVTQSTAEGRYPVWEVDAADPSRKKLLMDDPLLALMAASPDGRWLAMVLMRGRPEIYVRPLFKDGAPELVSAKGGHAVAWSRKTGELLYARGPEIVAITFREEKGAFRVQRERIFARVEGAFPEQIFEAAPDARVLLSMPVVPEPAPQLRVVLNFGRALERRFSGR